MSLGSRSRCVSESKRLARTPPSKVLWIESGERRAASVWASLFGSLTTKAEANVTVQYSPPLSAQVFKGVFFRWRLLTLNDEREHGLREHTSERFAQCTSTGQSSAGLPYSNGESIWMSECLEFRMSSRTELSRHDKKFPSRWQPPSSASADHRKCPEFPSVKLLSGTLVAALTGRNEYYTCKRWHTYKRR